MASPLFSKTKVSATLDSTAQATTSSSSGNVTPAPATAPPQSVPQSLFGASTSASNTASSQSKPLFGASTSASNTASSQSKPKPLFGASTSASNTASSQFKPKCLSETFPRFNASNVRSTYCCPSQCFFSRPDAVPSVRKTTPLCADLDELVTIELEDHGDKCFFQVHRGLLCFYSDYFRGAFHGSFAEAKNKSITLGDVNARTFRIFMAWLHFGNISDPDGKIGQDLHWNDMVRLWIFADKHLIPLLKNETMNLIIGKIIFTTTNPVFELPTIYENTAPGSPLRRILIDTTVYLNSMSCVEEPKASLWTVESLRELAIALFKKCNGLFDPSTIAGWNHCHYHDHTTDDETKKST